MYLFREVMNCKPGKVGEMVKKFKALNAVIVAKGHKPFRILTDVSGEAFWTVVLEGETASIGEFFEMEASVMGDKKAQEAMSGYHDAVDHGRREIFKIEA